MIDPGKFLSQLQSNGIEFFTGVPDSLMKELLVYVDQSSLQHYISPNEGLAVGLAAGYHFATGKIPLVYLQNSGLGNIINPITSLADKEVYGIPMILLIGWRGQPGIKDEPQHVKMGRITTAMLELLEIPFYILGRDDSGIMVRQAIEKARDQSQPVALLVPSGVFTSLNIKAPANSWSLNRELAIKTIYDQLDDTDTVVCTTGKIGREFDACNAEHQYRVKKYFLSVGAMGHANQVAAAISMFTPDNRTVMLDGDGALLMHMGSMPAIAKWTDHRYVHIVLNNEAHESVGGQATLAKDLEFTNLAQALGYGLIKKIDSATGLESIFSGTEKAEGPVFIEIKVNLESRANLSRPTITPEIAKQNLMQALDPKSKDHAN